MTTNEALVTSLREQIESKYQEAIKALEVLKGYLIEPAGTPLRVSVAAVDDKAITSGAASDNNGKTRVETVLEAIAEELMTVEQIEEATGLDESAVRAVLYSRFATPKLVRKKLGKKMGFKCKPMTAQVDGSDKEESAASLVRGLLAKHPQGLSASAIHAELDSQVTKMGGNPGAIGAALHNGKKRGKLVHNEGSGVYSLKP